MDETPDRPTASGDGDPPPTPPTSPTPLPDDPDDHTSDLPPLPDLEDPPARRALSPRRLFAAVGVVAVLAVVGFVGLTGGGGDGDDDGSDGVASIDGADGESADGDTDDGGGGGGRVDDSEFQDAMLEFAECMREHGIDMPDPEFDDGGGGVRIGGPGEPDGGGPSQEEFEAADEACSPIMEDVRPDIQLTPEEQAEMQDEMVAVAQCMRDKGWNMPDPEVGEGGEVRVQVGPDDETSGRAPTPENQEAHMEDMEACQDELGIEGRGPGGPSVATGGDT
jgi:hypothetical protein